MSSVIRSLVVKVGADLTDMQKGLTQASKNLKKAGKEISSVGSAMTKGLTVPIVGAVAGLTGLAIKSSETADELITMSNQLGISTNSLQKLQYASKLVDVEVEDMAKGMAKTTKAMGAASAKGEDYIKISDGLTLSTKDANGKLKDSEQMFYDTVDALGSMTDETQREIAAQNLFGKSYQDIMPLINAGSGALKSYGDEAERVGAVLSDKTVDSLGKLNDQWEKVKAVVTSAGAKIGAALIPVIEKLTPIIETKIVPAISMLADKISSLITWFSNLDPGVQSFILKLTGFLVVAGPVLSTLGGMATNIGALIKGVSSAVGVVQAISGAFSFLLGPAGLVIAAIAAIAAIAYIVIKNWGPISEFFKKLWADVSGAFVNAWNGIKSFFSGIWDWMKEFFSKWGPAILAVVAPFIGIPLLIFKNWGKITEFFKNLWSGVVDIVKNAINGVIKLINKIPGVKIPLIGTSSQPDVAPAADYSPSGIETYDVGTNYVPSDGLAFLHKGEAVIPADRNKGFSGGSINITITGNTISSDYDIDRIGNQLVKKLKLAGVRA